MVEREMREDHHEIQTPKKEHLPASSNRKAKQINAPSKKLHHQQQKSVKKSSTSVSTSSTVGEVVLNASEESVEKISSIPEAVDTDQTTIIKSSVNSDSTLVADNIAALQFPEEFSRISPISEAFVFDEDQSSVESCIMSLNPFISPPPVTPGSVEATPLSSTSPAEKTALSSLTTAEVTPSPSPITTDAAAVIVASVTSDGATPDKTIESLVKHQRESMFQVLHPADIDHQYKKLLDVLVKMVIEELCSLNEEKGMDVKLFSRKVKIMLLSFLLGLLAVFAGYFLFSDVQSSYPGPPPT